MFLCKYTNTPSVKPANPNAYPNHPASMEPYNLFIPPYSDYFKYNQWLASHFPHVLQNIHQIDFIENMNLLEDNLQIDSYDYAAKYHSFGPNDWKIFLREYLLQKYLESIADLIVIWEVTLYRANPVSYEEYKKIKESAYEHIMGELKAKLDPPKTSKAAMTQSNPLKASPMPVRQPPAYIKAFPMVKQLQDEHEKPSSKRKQKGESESSRKSHRKGSIRENESEYEYYNFVFLDSTDIQAGKELIKSYAPSGNSNDRKHRMNPAEFRPKFDKIT